MLKIYIKTRKNKRQWVLHISLDKSIFYFIICSHTHIYSYVSDFMEIKVCDLQFRWLTVVVNFANWFLSSKLNNGSLRAQVRVSDSVIKWQKQAMWQGAEFKLFHLFNMNVYKFVHWH